MLFIMCAGFGLAAFVCTTQVVLIRRDRFPRNRWLGITTEATRQSDAAWRRAHRAASPWIARAGFAAAVASVLAGIGLATGETNVSNVLLIGSAFVGAVAVAIFKLGAEPAARRAAISSE
jgi:hypothetical protein